MLAVFVLPPARRGTCMSMQHSAYEPSIRSIYAWSNLHPTFDSCFLALIKINIRWLNIDKIQADFSTIFAHLHHDCNTPKYIMIQMWFVIAKNWPCALGAKWILIVKSTEHILQIGFMTRVARINVHLVSFRNKQ